ncbi:MAG: hypothetical protein DRP68_00550 [Candidatus Omnitrophota bacterium]|nr:MAG: hypothetical protein DRP68_00550 [Candidatus Omnitrophota bacterium]
MKKRRSIRCIWCGSLNTKKHGKIKRTGFYLKSTKQKNTQRFYCKGCKKTLLLGKINEKDIPTNYSLK